MSGEPAGVPRRKDAERNRRRILAAAREVFCDRGVAATLNDIAHYAGLGVGTAYRHFANKEELMAPAPEAQFHPLPAAMAAGDPSAVSATLAQDVVLISPITSRFRFEGKSEVGELFSAVLALLTRRAEAVVARLVTTRSRLHKGREG